MSASIPKLSALLEELANIDLVAFEERHGTAFLILRDVVNDASPEDLLATRLGAPSTAHSTSATSDLNDLGNCSAYSVRKRSRTQYGGDYVSIGRGENNDIIFDHGTVSKFHAFLVAKGSTFALSDAGSRNGTRANEKPVPSYRDGDATDLRDGDQLAFGDVRATFMTSAALERLVGRLRRRA